MSTNKRKQSFGYMSNLSHLFVFARLGFSCNFFDG